MNGCDHPNDYWPFEEEAGFCPACRTFIGRNVACTNCLNKDLSQIESELNTIEEER